MKRNSFLYSGLFLVIITIISLIITFTTNADSPYASRIQPVTGGFPISCAENSIRYDMTSHVLAICTNLGYQSILTGSINTILPSQTGNSGKFLTTNGTVASWGTVSVGANTTLSNLASVAINTSLLPGTNNAIDLGSSSKRFKDGFVVGNLNLGSNVNGGSLSYVGGQGPQFIDIGNGGFAAQFDISGLGADRMYSFPSESGTICTTGSICSGYQAAGSFVSGTGTTNNLTKWTGSGIIGDSQITDDGTDITITAANLAINSGVAINTDGNIAIGNAGVQFLVSGANGDSKIAATAPIITNTAATSISNVTPLWGTGLAGTEFQIGQTGKIVTYGSAAPLDGQLLIGHTSANRFNANTLSAGSGISIINGAGSITISIDTSIFNLDKTITSAGTTGAQTINKPSGSVNFAAAATSLVVTNSLVTTSSVINCTVASNDVTLKFVQCVAGSGSFTMFGGSAATAETRVNFIVSN